MGFKAYVWRKVHASYTGRLFFIAEPTRLQCLSSFSTLLRFLMSIHAPVVASKTLGPSQVLEFIRGGGGIELDSTRTEARLLEDKPQHTRD